MKGNAIQSRMRQKNDKNAEIGGSKIRFLRLLGNEASRHHRFLIFFSLWCEDSENVSLTQPALGEKRGQGSV